MSKKGEKKKDSKARKEAKKEEEVYIKPFFAKVYDALRPGSYTPKEDGAHASIVFAILIAAFLVILGCCFVMLNAQQKTMEASLLIPSTSYAKGQEATVIDALEGNGFKQVSIEENGDIIAHGSSDMVSQYKESYRKRNVEKLSALLSNDYTSCGVSGVELSEDRKTLTITTFFKEANSALISPVVVDSAISDIIEGYGIWCRMVNDGEPMTIKFVDAVDGKEYYSSQRQNGDMIVADLEKDESDKAKADNANKNSNEKSDKDKNSNNSESTTKDNKNADVGKDSSDDKGNGNSTDNG